MADELKDALLEFVQALARSDIRVFLGGGYGLYLRQLSFLETDVRTYLPRDAWPRPRATADMDVFLPAEIITDENNMARVRETIDGLGYEPVPLRFLHFARTGSLGQIRIEFLSGPIDPADRAKVTVKEFRVRPRRSDPTPAVLHAYLTPEALDLDRDPVSLAVDGTTVLVPNSFSFLLMKLHAFRDRVEEEDTDDDGRHLGRHHALDVYRLVAMLTESEESFVRDRCAARWESEPVQTAAQTVAEYFAGLTSAGVLRLREHPLAGGHLDIAGFVDLLGDLFRQ